MNRSDIPMPRRLEPELMDLPEEADAYAQADFRAVNQAFVDRLLELAGDTVELRAIDLGTGPGDIPILLAQARPGWKIVAADASPAMLALARKNVAAAGLASIELVELDAKSSGLADNSFDVIFSNSLLHHLPEPDAFWSEIRRIGKPGALVFIRDLMRPASEAAARELVDQHAGSESKLLQEEFYRSLLAAFTPAEVRDQLAGKGLTELEVVTVTDRHLDIFGRLEGGERHDM